MELTKHFITESEVRAAFPPGTNISEEQILQIIYTIHLSIEEIVGRYPYKPTGTHIVIGCLLFGVANYISQLDENFICTEEKIIEYSKNLRQFADCHCYLTMEDALYFLLASELDNLDSSETSSDDE